MPPRRSAGNRRFTERSDASRAEPCRP
jgi:hypothetical protein